MSSSGYVYLDYVEMYARRPERRIRMSIAEAEKRYHQQQKRDDG